MNVFVVCLIVSHYLFLLINGNAIDVTTKSSISNEKLQEKSADSSNGGEHCSSVCQEKIEKLQMQIDELTNKFNSLCGEISDLSTHVMFHEEALRHIALSAHPAGGSRRAHIRSNLFRNEKSHVEIFNFSDSSSGDYDKLINNSKDDKSEGIGKQKVNLTNAYKPLEENVPLFFINNSTKDVLIEETSDVKSNETMKVKRNSYELIMFNETESFSNQTNDRNNNLNNTNENQSNQTMKATRINDRVKTFSNIQTKFCLNSKCNANTKFDTVTQTCSVLHNTDIQSETYKRNYEKWFNELITKTSNLERKLHFTFDNENLSSANNQTSNVKRNGNQKFHLKKDQNQPQNEQKFEFIDEMEKAIVGPESMIYATCKMRPNRHIALLLQEEIEGKISLSQSKYGGPVFMDMKIKGLRVQSSQRPSGGANTFRSKRESFLFPVIQDAAGEKIKYTNLQPGMISRNRGFHIHEFGDLSKDCQSTGPHYNPTGSLHGGPLDNIRHLGDLGNLNFDQNGELDDELAFPKISLQGEHSIIGRSIVIHSQPDDLGRDPSNPASATNGNTGAKVACCVIEKVTLKLPSDSRQVNAKSSLDKI